MTWRKCLLIVLLLFMCVDSATAQERDDKRAGVGTAPTASTGAKLPVVVLFGDSTTARRGDLTVYADHLSKMSINGRNIRVQNSGVPGDHTSRAAERFDTDVLAHHPDVVVIQFGINDSAIDVWKNPPAKQPRVSLSRYKQNLERFIDALQQKGASVILMTPNPLRWTAKTRELYGQAPYDPDDEEGFDLPLRSYVKQMRLLAKRRNVPLVDIHQLFSERGADKLLLDGIHPNAAGHRLVAESLAKKITRLLATGDK